MSGPYTYSNAELLDGMPMIGDHQCVALVKFYAHAPQTSLWRPGTRVRGAILHTGTAIATFAGDRYPNNASGNHAAFYLTQDASGIWVIDQWFGKKGGRITKRHIPFRGGHSDVMSNDGDSYWVIQ